MADIPANAAPIIDHPELPTLPVVPTPLPPATWDQDQQTNTLDQIDPPADPTVAPAAP